MKPKAEARRLELLGLQKVRYDGGIARYEGLNAERLGQLVAEGFADPEECQNDAPSIGKFLAFMRREPRALAHGYVVSPQRSDCRVSVEGLRLSFTENDDGKERARLTRAFTNMCAGADEFRVDSDTLYAWWD